MFAYAYGHISGTHVNPAVTFGLALNGTVKWGQAAFYWIAQFAGAILAAFLPKVLEFGRVIIGHDMKDKYDNRIRAGYYWGYRTQRAGMSQIKVKDGAVLFDSDKSDIMRETPAYKTFRTKVANTGLTADMHWGNIGRLGRKFVLIDTGSDSHCQSIKQVRGTPRPTRQLTLFRG